MVECRKVGSLGDYYQQWPTTTCLFTYLLKPGGAGGAGGRGEGGERVVPTQ